MSVLISIIYYFKQQILDVDSWVHIPNNQVSFPVLLNTHKPLNLNLESKLHVLVEANYRMFNIQQHITKCFVSLSMNILFYRSNYLIF